MYLVEATTLGFEHPQKLTNRYAMDAPPLSEASGQSINLFGNPHESFSDLLASTILVACCRCQIRATGLWQTLAEREQIVVGLARQSASSGVEKVIVFVDSELHTRPIDKLLPEFLLRDCIFIEILHRV